MSKSWKRITADEIETTNKFDKLKIGVPDFSAQDRISTKNFRLKTFPQGVLQAQEEKSGFWIFTTSNFACEKWPLNSYKLIFAIEYQWPLYLV